MFKEKKKKKKYQSEIFFPVYGKISIKFFLWSVPAWRHRTRKL